MLCNCSRYDIVSDDWKRDEKELVVNRADETLAGTVPITC
jgi:hypothetical protein